MYSWRGVFQVYSWKGRCQVYSWRGVCQVYSWREGGRVWFKVGSRVFSPSCNICFVLYKR